MADLPPLPTPGSIPWNLNPHITALNEEQNGRLAESRLVEDFLSDYSDEAKNKTLTTKGDSQGTVDSGTTPYGVRYVNRNGGTLTNLNVSASFWRDVAMRSVSSDPVRSEDELVLINCGINPANFYPTDGTTRKAEYQAVMASVLLSAVSSRIEHTSATQSGTWDPYTNSKLSGGSALVSTTSTSYVEWNLSTYGNYFSLGYSYRSGAGATGRSGRWTVNGVEALADTALAPFVTSLENVSSPNSAGNFVPHVVHIPDLQSGTVRVTVQPGSGITTADAIYKLSNKPPLIGVILPTFTRPGGSLYVSDEAVEVYRGDIRAAVAEVTSKYSVLRGRVLVIDPMDFGFDVTSDTATDGLHWGPTGQDKTVTASEKGFSRVTAMRPLMESFGIAGFNWPRW